MKPPSNPKPQTPSLKQQTLIPIADYATSSTILRQALNDTRSSKISIPNIKQVLLITRPNFNLEDETIEMASFFAERGIRVRVGAEIPVDDSVSERYPNLISSWDLEYCRLNGDDVDLVVTLGGDGTVLYSSSLFQERVPPIVAFHLGSLGFLTVFKHDTYQSVLTDILDGKPQNLNLRMRLQADIYEKKEGDTSDDLGELIFTRKVLNEVVVDRGVNSTMVNLDLFADGDPITTVLADGLVVATPTGSTAYNLSAGGPLVHPSKSSVLVTPICPHTLTARPMLLPSSLELRLSLSPNARGSAWVSFDGRDRLEIGEGTSVLIRTAVSSPFPSISHESSSKDWFNSLVSSLGWNSRIPQKKNRIPPSKL